MLDGKVLWLWLYFSKIQDVGGLIYLIRETFETVGIASSEFVDEVYINFNLLVLLKKLLFGPCNMREHVVINLRQQCSKDLISRL